MHHTYVAFSTSRTRWSYQAAIKDTKNHLQGRRTRMPVVNKHIVGTVLAHSTAIFGEVALWCTRSALRCYGLQLRELKEFKRTHLIYTLNNKYDDDDDDDDVDNNNDDNNNNNNNNNNAWIPCTYWGRNISPLNRWHSPWGRTSQRHSTCCRNPVVKNKASINLGNPISILRLIGLSKQSPHIISYNTITANIKAYVNTNSTAVNDSRTWGSPQSHCSPSSTNPLPHMGPSMSFSGVLCRQ